MLKFVYLVFLGGFLEQNKNERNHWSCTQCVKACLLQFVCWSFYRKAQIKKWKPFELFFFLFFCTFSLIFYCQSNDNTLGSQKKKYGKKEGHATTKIGQHKGKTAKSHRMSTVLFNMFMYVLPFVCCYCNSLFYARKKREFLKEEESEIKI